MGNETSNSRPDTVHFNIDTPDGTITVTAKKHFHVIENTDREMFKLTDNDKLVKGFFKTEVLAPYMLSGQTDRYEPHWAETYLLLYPLRAKIVRSSKKLQTVASMEFSNTSSRSVEYTWTVDQSKTKEETVKRQWYAETEIKSNVQIAYKILTLGTIDFSRKTKEQVESQRSETSNLSSKGEVKVPVGPNQAVLMKLEAIFHSVDIEVEYEATLAGLVRFGFKTAFLLNAGFQKIEDTLRINNCPTTVTYKEIITLEYYTDGDKISMTDIKTS